MNLEEFYSALAAAGYKWEKEKPAFLEDAKPARLRATVEPSPKDNPGELSTVCPITAVCFHQTGVFYDTTDFENAAERLELAPELYHSIIEAADKCPNSGPTFDNNPELVEIRARLKAAAGLPFDKPPAPTPTALLLKLMNLGPLALVDVCLTSDGHYIGRKAGEVGYNAFIGSPSGRPGPGFDFTRETWESLTDAERAGVRNRAANPPDGSPIDLEQFGIAPEPAKGKA